MAHRPPCCNPSPPQNSSMMGRIVLPGCCVRVQCSEHWQARPAHPPACLSPAAGCPTEPRSPSHVPSRHPAFLMPPRRCLAAGSPLGSVRLVAGLDAASGRVEVCYGNSTDADGQAVWGNVCDGRWGLGSRCALSGRAVRAFSRACVPVPAWAMLLEGMAARGGGAQPPCSCGWCLARTALRGAACSRTCCLCGGRTRPGMHTSLPVTRSTPGWLQMWCICVRSPSHPAA